MWKGVFRKGNDGASEVDVLVSGFVNSKDNFKAERRDTYMYIRLRHLHVKVAIKVLRGAAAHDHVLHQKVKTVRRLLSFRFHYVYKLQDLTNAGRRWLKLKHPNILRFYGLVNDYGYLPAMVSTYCNAGNILEYISDDKASEKRKLELVGFRLHLQELVILISLLGL